ncbi:right-handed parallel beta-helix repeat-containing protein [Candidatus Eisenbacteria bacterium]|uniref:Right-handed parallel beta-helix repeat-containing protein n=1 Tax=Eiseniibacteriota bacterium TaxID=2212470 RepID=A0ABV6YLR8_UNCEI
MMHRCLAAVALILVMPTVAHPTTYLVTPDGTGDFPTIQAAIDAVADGDTIALADGTFTGVGNRDIDLAGKPVTVRSQSGDREACIIDCQGSAVAPHRGFHFYSGEDSTSVVEDLSIINGYVDKGGAIWCQEASRPTIHNCIFRDNEAEHRGGGVFCTATPKLSDCLFLSNTSQIAGGGLTCWADSLYHIVRCTFAENASDLGGAVSVAALGEVVMTECTMVANAGWSGGGGIRTHTTPILLSNSIIAFSTQGEAISMENSVITAQCCDIYENAGGDWVGDIADQLGIDGNIAADPIFCTSHLETPYALRDDSPCAAENNPGCSQIGAWPVGCTFGNVWIVNPEGTGDYATIQAAVNAAADGDTIALTDGTFTGPGNRDIDFAGKAIAVRSQSGDREACIIDCDGSAIAPHRGFHFYSGEDSNAVVEALSIINGYIDKGGAIWCQEYSRPTIRNCIFRDNEAEERGGGLFCTSAPKLSDCVFTSNAAQIAGGGLTCWADSLFNIVRCTFADNSADLGGAVSCATIYGVRLTDCTLVANAGWSGGAGVRANGTPIVMSNSIIAFGTQGEAMSLNNSVVTAQCSDIYGNAGGDWVGDIADQLGVNGNISEDPLLCAPDSADFTLCGDSPCASENNPGCGQIGAWGVSCDPCRPGTCCMETGECYVLTGGGCSELGGTWSDALITCDPNPCPIPTEIQVDTGGLINPEPWHDYISSPEESPIPIQAYIPDHYGDVQHVEFYYSIDDSATWVLIEDDIDGYEPWLDTIDGSVIMSGCGWSTSFVVPDSTPAGPIQFKSVAYVDTGDSVDTVEDIQERKYDPLPPSLGRSNITDFTVIDRDALGIEVTANGAAITRVIVHAVPMDPYFTKGIPGINQQDHSETHCAPTAAAQCLKYFESEGDSLVSGGLSDFRLVEALGAYMSTNQNVSGTVPSKWVGGVGEWIRDYESSYTVRYYVHYACDSVSVSSWTEADWQRIRNELELCRDVLLGVFWDDGGGHALTLNSIAYGGLADSSIHIGFKDPWTGSEETGELDPRTGHLSNLTGAGGGRGGQIGVTILVSPEEDEIAGGIEGDLLYDGPLPTPADSVTLPTEGWWFLHITLVDDSTGHAHRITNVVVYDSDMATPEDGGNEPLLYTLEPCVPNPFHAGTLISYAVPVRAQVSLNAYDVAGRRVRTLVDSDVDPGSHRLTWAGLDQEDRPLCSGIYYLKMKAAGFEKTRRVTIVR